MEIYLFRPKHTLFGGEAEGIRPIGFKKIYLPQAILVIPVPLCIPITPHPQ